MNAAVAFRASRNGRAIVRESIFVIGYANSAGVWLLSEDGASWDAYPWNNVYLNNEVRERVSTLEWAPEEPKSPLAQFLDYT